jgi:16S rRNA (guanine527-N7)-methyltransferase
VLEPRTSLDRFGFVTPEIRNDLERYVALLQVWQRTHNLVAASTLEAVWDRHVADSLQLLAHAPDFREWVDLGSGAGFPGLVVAIAGKGRQDARFTLVESNLKKAAFLRTAIRESGANAVVAAERIETHGPKMAGRADVISARALAPFRALCGLAAPYLHARSVLLLLKGRDFVHELELASKSWSFDVISSPSATDSTGRVVTIRNLSPKVPPS